MSADDTSRCRYASFADTLTEFGRSHGVEAIYDPGLTPWGDPHYRIRWENPHAQICVLYLNWLRENQFMIHIFCWPPEAGVGPPEQRWSRRAASGFRKWYLTADENGPASLRDILKEAKNWADEVRGPAGSTDIQCGTAP